MTVMLWTWLTATVLLTTSGVFGLENGLARRPPMGWMSWLKFMCETDCVNNPNNCINEDLYMAMADHLIENGFRDAGYEYIHIDDCWMSKERDASGRLTADSDRFPSGIPALADYMHNRSLKLGIYEDFGTETCQGYPGSIDHLEDDAKTFAQWNVDYLKLDGCNSDADQMKQGYPEMSQRLNVTGRSIVYSCSWPAYLQNQPDLVDYNIIEKYCNLWRNFDDIASHWDSVLSIIKYYNNNQEKLIPVHGPSHWNDPDMIIVGDLELSVAQSIAQMTVWCIWSAPLIMSNDLRTITPEYTEILLNRDAIAIDQDPLGRMGRMINDDGRVYVYVKEITPVDTAKHQYSYAFAVLNYINKKTTFETDLASLGLTNPDGYDLYDVWKGCSLGRLRPFDKYTVKINATGAVLIRATLPDMSNGLQEASGPTASKRQHETRLFDKMKKMRNDEYIV